MKSIYIDVMIGAIFVAGLFSFLMGGFIISSAFFASATIASFLNNSKQQNTGDLSC